MTAGPDFVSVTAAAPTLSSQLLGSGLIGLREGLEAGIVVMILIAFLVKSQRRDGLKWVWLGVAGALAMTIGVFLVMLFLYATRIIRVTDRLRIGVIAATGGVFVAYLISWVFSLFTHGVPSIFDAGPVGIIFSVIVVAIASFNLLLDFDFIDRGVEARYPKGMEWFLAFGLVVTLVWLYIEMLRLLSKLRQ